MKWKFFCVLAVDVSELNMFAVSEEVFRQHQNWLEQHPMTYLWRFNEKSVNSFGSKFISCLEIKEQVLAISDVHWLWQLYFFILSAHTLQIWWKPSGNILWKVLISPMVPTRSVLQNIWDNVFKNGLSKICVRQPWKILN